MEGFGVIVECSHLEHKYTENLSCSGIYLGKGVVLTHGTIVLDILNDKRAQSLLHELKSEGHVCIQGHQNLLGTVLEVTQSSFQVILPTKQLHSEPTSTEPISSTLSASLHAKRLPHEVLTTKHQDSKIQMKDPNSLFPTREVKHVSSNSSQISRQSTLVKMASPSYCSLPADVEIMFVQPGIKESIASIMPASQGWKLMDNEEKELDTDLENLILSTFVLLKILPNLPSTVIENTITKATCEDIIDLTKEMLSLTTTPSKGMSVYVESSPFGSLSPSVFLNSLSCGIISNVSNTAGDIMLTDARCIMGTEGAPVFAVIGGKKRLCGMVVSPFCWRGGEWLGLTLLASMKQILQALLHSLNNDVRCENGETTLQGDKRLQEDIMVVQEKKYCNFISKKGNMNTDFAHYLNGSVVAVCCGGGWGSGTVISTSPGIILTCAHVTEPATSGIVRIKLANGKSIPGRVIHQTRPCTLNHQNETSSRGSSIWDLAIVVTYSALPLFLPLASTLPPKGSPVVVAGYGVFSPNHLPTPTLSHGVISKVVNFPVHSLQWPSQTIYRNDDLLPVKNVTECNTGMVVNRVCEDLSRQNNDEGVAVIGDLKKSSQDLLKSDSFRSGDIVHPNIERSMDGCTLVSSDDRGMMPMIMQTTCAVYAGTSGGPVVSLHPQHGLQVVGIVVCNTCDTGNKATFPHINLAIPAAAISKIIQAFLSSGDVTALKYLDAECSIASQLWLLGPMPESRL